MMQIENTSQVPRFALFELGFRPFFAGAAVFAALGMLLWMLIYQFGASLALGGLNPVLWHAHEMVFGYAMAVVAGFLLTAVSNWTGIRTWRGVPLFLLFACWVVARLAWLLPVNVALVLAATADMLFMFSLIIGVSLPIIRVRQWKQAGILSKLLLMAMANGMFYASAFGWLQEGQRWGLYSGLYLILALIFVMARRVLPFFIERGVEENFTARQRQWLDVASLILFLVWATVDVFIHQPVLLGVVSVVLFCLHALRLYDWHTPGIWQRPLLWSLFLAYASLMMGFLLKALSVWWGVSPNLSLHAFAVGGIGLMTVGMMSRVALGHTGRNVFEPPRSLVALFLMMIVAMITRVMLPLADSSHYMLWIGLSQLAWILGFVLFLAVYLPLLIRPRIDGRPD